MNNLSITLALVVPTATVLLWQNAASTRAEHANQRLAEQIAARQSEVGRLNRSIQDLRREVRRAEPASSASTEMRAVISTKSPAHEPTPEELCWDNGTPYLWLDKKLLTSLGIPSFRQRATVILQDPAMSAEAMALFTQFNLHHLNEASTLTPEQRNAFARDPIEALKLWASHQPPALVEEVANGLRVLTSDALNAVPTYEIDPSAATLLGLEPTQVTRLEQVIGKFAESVQALDRQHLEILPAESVNNPQQLANKLVLRIPPITEETKALRNDLEANIESVVGKDRADYLVRMARQVLSSDFTGLENYERKLVLSFEGQKYHAAQTVRGSTSTHSGAYGVPRLDATWRPFIRKTMNGFELVKQ